MVIHRHLAYAYCVGHLLVRQPLQIAQTENLLAEGRFEVVDELGQSVEPVVGIGIEYDIGTADDSNSWVKTSLTTSLPSSSSARRYLARLYIAS